MDILNRVFAAIIVLTLGVFLVRWLCATALAALARLGELVPCTAVLLLLAMLLSGAIAKAAGRVSGRDRRTGREHHARDLIRQSVRRPADDVPLDQRVSAPDDDPLLDDEVAR